MSKGEFCSEAVARIAWIARADVGVVIDDSARLMPAS